MRDNVLSWIARMQGIFSDHKLDNSIVLEFYKQAQQNSKAYMELRFKHFTTFMVVTALVGSVLRLGTFSTPRLPIAILACTITILFWLLDRRTSQYHGAEVKRVRHYERMLGDPSPPAVVGKVLMKANTATNLLFLLALAAWITVGLCPIGAEKVKSKMDSSPTSLAISD